MSYSQNKKSKIRAAFPQVAIVVGILLLVSGMFLLLPILISTIPQEVGYWLRSPDQKQVVPEVAENSPQEQKADDVSSPIDAEFGIVIPKIGANAAIIPNVDPFNATEYQQKLAKGIAHAEGTVYPGDTGNMFLFAHSAANNLQARRYNAVFYLLNKLNKEDKIYIFYQGERFTYRVQDKRYVDASEVSYLSSSSIWDKQLTLMTCWPPGTTAQRLLILAELN
ncbi:MAG: sortase [Patescibacteria group bacterium]